MSPSKSSVCDIFDNLFFFGKGLDKLILGIIHHKSVMQACLYTLNWPIQVDLKKNDRFSENVSVFDIRL